MGFYHCVVLQVFLMVMQVIILVTPGANGNSVKPEFVEPLKNITIGEGSNVEFSCAVANLGSFRVMWLKKNEQKETFVAVNLLKITKNPRVSISMLQTSDDVTQSTVYIRSIDMDLDQGVYECAINTNPMISRTGTLVITKSKEKAFLTTPNLELKPTESVENENSLKVYNDSNVWSENFTELNATQDQFDNGTETLDMNMTSSSNISSGSDSGCAEMKSYWEDATDNIKAMLKNVLTSLVNFTCSFLTSNQ